MKGEADKFTKGAVAKGYTPEDAQAVFDLIEPFAGYAFNKAHSVSYGTIAYQTAYLKANYPEEYMTAVMMMAGTHERIAEAFSECVRLTITLLRPDINHSDVNFDCKQQIINIEQTGRCSTGDPLRARAGEERRRGHRGGDRRGAARERGVHHRWTTSSSASTRSS